MPPSSTEESRVDVNLKIICMDGAFVDGISVIIDEDGG
jgi:hypothetical protein